MVAARITSPFAPRAARVTIACIYPNRRRSEMDWVIIGLLVGLVMTASGLYVDTKTRLARIEHKLNLLLQHSGIEALGELRLSERVKEIARDPKRKIEAIKVYREETGAGLAEAKQAVELYINSL
jgi:hypothetical protein